MHNPSDDFDIQETYDNIVSLLEKAGYKVLDECSDFEPYLPFIGIKVVGLQFDGSGRMRYRITLYNEYDADSKTSQIEIDRTFVIKTLRTNDIPMKNTVLQETAISDDGILVSVTEFDV